MPIDPFEANQDQDDSLFNDIPQVDPEKDYLEELVGEGKKYKDERALARATAEKEAFIQRLKNELSGIRKELNSRQTVEELLTKIAQPRQPEPSEPNDDEGDQRKTYTPEEVEALIQSTLDQRESTRQRESNLNQVRTKLNEVFGDNANRVIAEKAKELEVGVEFLKELAQNKPNAFLKLVGAETPKSQEQEEFFSLPRSSTDTTKTAFSRPTGVKNYKYYQEMLKKDPVKYWSIETQNEMHEQAVRSGADFYK